MRDNDLKDFLDKIQMLEKVFNINLNHYKYVLEGANTIWMRSPFKVGDLVRLNKTPEITEEKSWGWLGAKHFLIKGALARVETRQFYDGKFVYGLSFDEESYISPITGKVTPVKDNGIYSFGESWLESAEYEQLTCEAL